VVDSIPDMCADQFWL